MHLRPRIYDLAFVLLLFAAAALRFAGLDWDEGQHLHPDERFLTGVVASLRPVSTLGEYFDTANSSLNPNNTGHSFYVYGNFPIILTRYLAEALSSGSRYDNVYLLGRGLSALTDLGLIALVYFTASRLFDKRVGLLAAAFSSFTVMQIQQSHFFTVDNFSNFFTYLTLYFAIRIATPQARRSSKPRLPLADIVGFGIALGFSMASKLSSPLLLIVLAGALPVALLFWLARQPKETRETLYTPALTYLLLGAGITLLTFRIFHPYAFIGFGLNPHWVDTMRSLAAQVSGDADWPPSMQWARRSVLFGFQNMVRWGLGWPLALTSWAGFIWAGWRSIQGEWRKPQVIIWAWGAIYMLSQSLGFNPTMRYFLPVYPALAILGAWAVFALWHLGARVKKSDRWQRLAQAVALGLGLFALVGAALWSLAFVQVYRQDVSRVAATRWIYQNLPGPLTLTIAADGEEIKRPISVPYSFVITPDIPYMTGFSVRSSGQITHLDFNSVLAPIQLELSSGPQGEILIARINQVADLLALSPGEISKIEFVLPTGAAVDPATPYQIKVTLPVGQGDLLIQSAELRNSQNAELPAQVLLPEALALPMGETATFNFSADPSLFADRLVLMVSTSSNLQLAPLDLEITFANPQLPDMLLVQEVTIPASTSLTEKESVTVTLDQAIPVLAGQDLTIQIALESPGAFSLLGSAIANETSWDDGLPLRMDGYDGFGGIYQGDLNFEMYWDENAEKLDRFTDILDRAEYLIISSSRQWGSLPRIPERFPLVTAYYRALIGCPVERSIDWCYVNAQPGDLSGELGFELIQVFENAPQLGSFRINDQSAEEAFTVYDHPKVFIFKKTAAYDSASVAALLGAVDLENVIRLTPKQAGSRVLPNLMLPEDRLAQQRAGGTWSDLFSRDYFVNTAPWVSAVVWYLVLMLLGIAVYPLVRLAMPGLRDGGYPFARLAALLLLAYFAWLGGSLGLTYSRAWLAFFAVLLVLAGEIAAWFQRAELKGEWRLRRDQFLRTEILFLAFLLFMLLIRLGNSDLWHPGKGGEKPMDFAYFNAVLKSTSFPPYDPWFAGGYINYYYYGFVLVGSLVKLLGIIPAVAYNLILPTLFAMIALGAHSVAWNVWTAWRARSGKGSPISANFVGLVAALAVVLLGNLGSLQMIFQGYVRLGSAGALAADSGVLERLGWMLRGFVQSIGGAPLPFPLSDWYWNPTRIIPALNESAPITEFPIFTFTYADLHAHMISLPVTLLALAWALSAVLSRAWEGARRWAPLAWSLAFGAITIGSLRPINTWDFPTYLLIAMIATAYASWRFWPRTKKSLSWVWTLGAPVILAALSVLAYQPFAWWYRQGYASVELWKGTHTPTGSYLIHWGIFLFFIVAWMLWELRQWLASTPLSSLRKLQPHQVWIYSLALIFVFAIILLTVVDVFIAWLLLPLLALAGLLLLRPKQDEWKRIVLFVIGTGLFLTLFVEVIVLKGDVARMNTVFKFYMQAWVLLAIAATLAAAWTLDAMREWLPSWRSVWQVLAAGLLTCAGLFLLLGVTAKVRDRMANEAPRTLDGMGYMEYAIYYDQDQGLELREDYEAIRWMQDNIVGSPVIVEAYTSEYRWGARIAINTGLPSVLGWNFHQRQQREFVPGNDIWGRVDDVNLFYNTADLQLARDFLAEYQVHYIIVGQMEQAYYPGGGLDKFEAQDGLLWREVFRVGDTVIYEVFPSTLANE
jgi:YYY domain-containing protein